jgi:hypothetical protein
MADFVHAAARPSAHFDTTHHLVGSPRVTHINFWTTLLADLAHRTCTPQRIATLQGFTSRTILVAP